MNIKKDFYQSSFTILNFSSTVLDSLNFCASMYAFSYLHPKTSPQSEHETSATLYKPVMSRRSILGPTTTFITWENKKALRRCLPYKHVNTLYFEERIKKRFMIMCILMFKYHIVFRDNIIVKRDMIPAVVASIQSWTDCIRH